MENKSTQILPADAPLGEDKRIRHNHLTRDIKPRGECPDAMPTVAQVNSNRKQTHEPA